MTTVMVAAASGAAAADQHQPVRKSPRLQRSAASRHSKTNATNTETAATTLATPPAPPQSAEALPNADADAEVSISTSTSTPTSASRTRHDERERGNKKRRRVSFESADIVEFEPTMFTTSVTSGGIPVGLSSQERSRSRRRLDSWEMEREDQRICRQRYMEEGYLDPSERAVILSNAGCGETSMATVEAEVNQIIMHRRESNEIDYGFLCGLVSIAESHPMEEEHETETGEGEGTTAVEEVVLFSPKDDETRDGQEKEGGNEDQR